MSDDKDKVLWIDHRVVSQYDFNGKLVLRKEFPPEPVTVRDLENALNLLESLTSDEIHPLKSR